MKVNIKRYMIRTAAVVLAVIMAVTALAGCRKKQDSLYVPPEFIYVAQTIPLPADIINIDKLIYFDEKLYYVAMSYEESGEGVDYKYIYNSKIYSLSTDGTGNAQLPGYKPPAAMPPGAQGGSSIMNMVIDGIGNIWVVERWDYNTFNLPDGFDPNLESPYNYYETISTGSCVRKLDINGTELFTVSLDGIGQPQGNFYVNAFNVDNEGNIYVAINNPDYEVGGMIIYVLDSDGAKLFEIKTSNWINSLIKLPDGDIAFISDSYDDVNGYNRFLQRISLEKRALGDTESFPSFGWEVYPGGGDYQLLISDFNYLYGFTLGQEEPDKVVNWMESDILNNNIRNIIMLDEDTILCTNSNYNRVTMQDTAELVILTKTPYSEIPKKEVITLASVGLGQLRESVVTFNRTNPDYRIIVIDYNEYNNEDNQWTGAMTRLSTDIISGNLPDILDVSSLPMYKEYVARGLLADLYPFLDSDPTYSRSDFVDGAYRAAEINGGLYQIFPSFSINTIIGNPRVVGSGIGWTMEEFKKVLDENPQADIPLGSWLTKSQFLQAALSYGIDNYIDWSAGKAYFDSPDFIALLEFSNSMPDEIDWDSVNSGLIPFEDVYVSPDEAIATGRQIMLQTQLYDYGSIIWNRSMFGGEVVYKGFPTENRNGNSLSVDSAMAIIEKSPNKDGAWQFIRMTLDKDYQLQYTWGLATNKQAFEERAAAAKLQDYYVDTVSPRMVSGSRNGGSVVVEAPPAEPTIVRLTDSDIDEVRAVIASASGTYGWTIDQSIWEIVEGITADYFKGIGTAQSAAADIQSRLSLLVSERSK